MIDLYASRIHYARHLVPYWRALPPDIRGHAYAPRNLWGGLNALGIAPVHPVTEMRAEARPVMVASYTDEKQVSPRPVVYVEHGAGQSYVGANPGAEASYSGGPGHERALLFVCPNQSVADRWRVRYPKTPSVVTGAAHLRQRPRTPTEQAVILSFHADLRVCPETRWAFPHYAESLRDLAARFDVLGHGHPRILPRLKRHYDRVGVPVVGWEEALERGAVLVADNTSAGPEWVASTGRPLIWLNAPWYRRDVDHGGRFWAWTQGIPTVDGPQALVEAIDAELADPVRHLPGRRDLAATCYAALGEPAARVGASAIARVVEEWLDGTHAKRAI